MFARTRLRLGPSMEDIVAAFRVLGLTYNLHLPTTGRPGVEDVRRQYREMARLHHPDLSNGDDNRMKVINTAYELIQSSGVLQGSHDTPAATAASASTETGAGAGSSAASRFARKAGSRRRRMPDDFANGDDSSWSMKTQLDWQAMMQSTDTVTEEEMKNPANHPFSHSRFFSFEDDVSIYRMIRGGATVRQVARTLGKPATFVERRLQNAQFKLRVQYVLRHEKRGTAAAVSGNGSAKGSSKDANHSAGPSSSSRTGGHTTSTPITEPTTRRVVRRSPYEDASNATADGGVGRERTKTAAVPPTRRKEWEPSYPEWRAPRYRDQMTLEEQGRLDGLLREDPVTAGAATSRGGRGRGRGDITAVGKHGVISKIGRTYENYQRMRRA